MLIVAAISAGEIYFYKFEFIFCAIPGQIPCTNCQANYYLTSMNTCLDIPNFVQREGVFLNRVIPCSDDKCLWCKNNFAICTACDTAINYYLNGDVCVLNTDIKDQFGPDLATGKVMPCSDVNCKDCRTNVNQCDRCMIDYTLTTAVGGSCILNPGLPSLFGPNPTTGVMTSCSTVSCDKCKKIYTSCDWCLAGFSVVDPFLCLDNNQIVDEKGANLATGRISDCDRSNCKWCKQNHLICTWCISGYSLELNTCTKFEDIVDCRGPNLMTG